MKSDSQFVRWGIPGWTMAVSFLTFVLIDYVSANDDRMYLVINSAFGKEGVWSIVLAGFLIAGAGIPLGYLIYQIYFYLRWVSPVSKNGFLPPLLTGRMQEMQASLRDINILDLDFGQEWRRQFILETKDHRAIWYYISAMLSEALLTLDHDDVLHKHLSYLKETLHSLGASNLGFGLGYVAYLIMKWKMGQATLATLVLLVILYGCTMLLLSENYGPLLKKWLAPSGKHVETPAELFIACLFFLYATLNPAMNRLVPHYLVWFSLAGLAFIWGLSAHENKWGIWTITLVLIVVAVILYNLQGYTAISETRNWPVMLSMLIFSAVTIAFLKIRQNTVDGLTAFQYYITRLFLEKRAILKRSESLTDATITTPSNLVPS
jgi:hypothetical protein